MWDLILDVLIDTLKVFAIVLVIHILLSFVENKLAKFLSKKNGLSPLIGSSVGLIPQCGISIVSVDLYKKRYITMGTLIAIFLSCSDEALPVLLSSGEKFYHIFPLLAIKFVVGLSFGYLVDLIFKTKDVIKLSDNEHDHDHEHEMVHVGCCHHEIDNKIETKKDDLKKHLIHPLVHSLKISLYVLIINFIFGLIIYYVGENSIKDFLDGNIYLTPILSTLVGLIPNCASSVIITELYISSSLSFGATLAGLCCNAGLGLIYLYKDKKNIKNSLKITMILVTISIFVGYVALLIEKLCF